jgi:hypothetical protein
MSRRFTVEIPATAFFTSVVEADSEDEAEGLALEDLQKSAGDMERWDISLEGFSNRDNQIQELSND